MSFIAAAAIGSLALGAYKTVKGANQSSAANKLAKNNHFTPEQMPWEVKQATDLAAQNYTNGMPGTAYARQAIDSNAASAFYNGSQGASSGGDLLDLAGKINYGQNQATNQLAAQQAQYKQQALGGYDAALGNQANWQGRLYQNNVLQPYLRTANLAASMYGAGQQNMYSGLDDIGSTVVGAARGYGSGANTAAAAQQYNGSPVIQPGYVGDTPYPKDYFSYQS
jgi:hypothetical protein